MENSQNLHSMVVYSHQHKIRMRCVEINLTKQTLGAQCVFLIRCWSCCGIREKRKQSFHFKGERREKRQFEPLEKVLNKASSLISNFQRIIVGKNHMKESHLILLDNLNFFKWTSAIKNCRVMTLLSLFLKSKQNRCALNNALKIRLFQVGKWYNFWLIFNHCEYYAQSRKAEIRITDDPAWKPNPLLIPRGHLFPFCLAFSAR